MELMWFASQSHFHLLLIFFEINFYFCHSCVMFAMKSMSICNDYMNYDDHNKMITDIKT